MEISFSSIFSSALSVSLLTGLLFVIVRRKNIITHFGLGCMYILSILILFRGLFPFDFTRIGFTTSIYSKEFLPWLRDIFLTKIFSINTFIVTPYKFMLALWVVGSVVFAYRIIKGYWNAANIVKFSPKITDVRVSHIFQHAIDTIWTNSHPNFQLVQNDSFSSPALFGISKPIIILPHLDFSDEEFFLVFRHELLHHKHKDYIFKLLVDLLRIIYWWNPLIYILFSSLTSHIQELWVDYQISNASTKNQRISYMQTLTTLLKHNEQHSNLQTTDNSIILLSDERKNFFMRQRLDYIKSKDVASFTLYGIAICVALFFSTYTIVFEAKYHPTTDEKGVPVFQDLEGQTYYIRNGDKYDLYMEHKYVGTFDKIHEGFEDCPVYNSIEEVPKNEN